MRPPCDENVIRSANAQAPCSAAAKNWVLAATILASSIAFVDSTVVNVALPALQGGLHATVVDVQWVVESYGLLLGALILVGGSLGDLWGRRRMFVTGTVIFALASAACGAAPSIRFLVLARSFQGLGAALLVPGSLAIISVSFDEKSRGAAIGTWSGFTAITTAIGPVLGGWLIQHASWRWAFFINLPLAAAVVAITLRHVPESRGESAGPVDWLGALTAALGLGGLVFSFVESANLGWTHPLVFGTLIAGVACLFAFLFIEERATSPMVPLNLFASRGFSGANLLTLLLYAAVGIFFFLFPMNLIQVQGYSATAAGMALLPFILIMFLLSRWSGALVTRFGARLPLVVGPLIVTAGFVLFTVPAIGGSYWKTFFPAIVVLGLGMAATVAPLTTVVMNSVPPDRAGAASGVNNAVARVAGVLAIATLGIVMVTAFSSRLNRSLANLSLAPAVLHDIQADEIKLAGLRVPDNLDPGSSAMIRESVAQAFLFGFRVVMLICAGLSAASAVAARLMIPDKPRTTG
jgi:EmrB/QacA subfamily drug resistance transporter